MHLTWQPVDDPTIQSEFEWHLIGPLQACILTKLGQQASGALCVGAPTGMSRQGSFFGRDIAGEIQAPDHREDQDR